MNIQFSEQDIAFMRDNLPSKGITYCSKSLNKPRPYVARLATKLNIKIDRRFGSKIYTDAFQKPQSSFGVRLDTFEKVGSPETAYFLGFLWADGYVGQGAISFTIATEDFLSLEGVFQRLGQWKISQRRPGTRVVKPITRIRISNKPLADFLINELDYSAKSSAAPLKVLEHIPPELRYYWWRGYFDGDGTIVDGKCKRLGFSSCYDQDWSCAESLMIKLGCIFSTVKYESKLGHKHSSLRSCGKANIFKFFKFLYPKDGFHFGLERKFKKFQTALTNLGPMGRLAKNEIYHAYIDEQTQTKKFNTFSTPLSPTIKQF